MRPRSGHIPFAALHRQTERAAGAANAKHLVWRWKANSRQLTKNYHASVKASKMFWVCVAGAARKHKGMRPRSGHIRFTDRRREPQARQMRSIWSGGGKQTDAGKENQRNCILTVCFLLNDGKKEEYNRVNKEHSKKRWRKCW